MVCAIMGLQDIAIGWATALLVFGKGHPAINYLLLLAILDDAIGAATTHYNIASSLFKMATYFYFEM